MSFLIDYILSYKIVNYLLWLLYWSNTIIDDIKNDNPIRDAIRILR